VFGIKHSLHRNWRDAKAFYSIYAVVLAVAAGIVLIPNAPLGLITVLVQALAGILLPSATVFLLLLCNDKAMLGPWVNKTWQNILGSIIVGVLTMLSLILATNTLFPTWNVTQLTEVLGGITVAGIVAITILQLGRKPTSKEANTALDTGDRWTWRMPPLDTLPKGMPSKATAIGMLVLRAYLVVAVLLLIVKAVELFMGH
jgi:hypothetical protein